MSHPATGRRAGKWMLVVGWLLILAMLTWLFRDRLDREDNPNRVAQAVLEGDRRELHLIANRAGHYIAPGSINGVAATFLLDTGASAVVVPQALADRFGLRAGPAVRVQTANGVVTSYFTRIERLQVGGIELTEIEALLNPGMSGDDEILLGMTALSQLEMSQRGTELVLAQPAVTPR